MPGEHFRVEIGPGSQALDDSGKLAIADGLQSRFPFPSGRLPEKGVRRNAGLIEPAREGPHRTAFRMRAIGDAESSAPPRPGPFWICLMVMMSPSSPKRISSCRKATSSERRKALAKPTVGGCSKSRQSIGADAARATRPGARGGTCASLRILCRQAGDTVSNDA